MTPDEQAAIRAATQTATMGNVLAWDNARPRSTQTHIGPSELGHCREYVRAKVAGDEQRELPIVKWAAFIGTAVGEMLEEVMKTRGAMTQTPVSYTLPRHGFQVHGSLDVLWPKVPAEYDALPYDPPLDGTVFNQVWDWKSKDGIDGVMREGPARKEWIQISVYLLAALDRGYVDEDGIGVLVYYDRSGKDKQVWTQAVTVREARGWIETAEERLDDVIAALAKPSYGDGERHLRDEAESHCFYFGCPFYWQCWPESYQPDGVITDERSIKAMEQYDAGRELAKVAKKLQDEAKGILGVGEENPVAGRSDTWQLDWKLRESYGVLVRQIDLRRRRDA